MFKDFGRRLQVSYVCRYSPSLTLSSLTLTHTLGRYAVSVEISSEYIDIIQRDRLLIRIVISYLCTIYYPLILTLRSYFLLAA